ncbi:MAG: biotin/lipoyl-binding protein [Cyanobacteria bacterium J06621_11]
MNATSSHSDASTNLPNSQANVHPTRRLPGLPFASWKLLLALPLVLVPVVWQVISSNDEGDVAEIVQHLPVETMRLRAADGYSTTRTYSGELVAQRSSDLGFERGGTVVALLVDEGDVVNAGDPLARLDVRDLEAQRSQLEAQQRQVLAQLQELQTGPRREDIASAEAAVSDLNNQLELASLQAQRRATLFEQGAIPAEELDERQFEANAIADRLQQAQSQLEELHNGTRPEQISAQVAQVEQIEASIRAIDISLDKSVLYAPFAGRVSQRLIDEGSIAVGSQQVIRLVESSVIEAKIGVPAQVAQRLSVGTQQALQVGTRTYRALITAKLPEVDEASQTVTIVLEVMSVNDLANDLANELTIGTTAKLTVNEQQSASGYWVPSTALIAGERGLWSVYVLTPESDLEDNLGDSAEVSERTYRVARRDVELLHSDTGGKGEEAKTARSFIRGLVSEGEQIVTSGTHRVVIDQLVIPNDAGSSQVSFGQTSFIQIDASQTKSREAVQ